MALGLTYLRAIERAGGIPVVIPPLEIEAIPSLLAHLHGVLLSGGPDIHPESYGESPHPELGPTWRDLDATELALARQAIVTGCRCSPSLAAPGAEHRPRRNALQHLPEHSAVRSSIASSPTGRARPIRSRSTRTAPSLAPRVHRTGRQLLPPPVHQRPWPRGARRGVGPRRVVEAVEVRRPIHDRRSVACRVDDRIRPAPEALPGLRRVGRRARRGGGRAGGGGLGP